LVERENSTVEECAGFIAAPTYTWIHVQGAVSRRFCATWVRRSACIRWRWRTFCIRATAEAGELRGPLFAVLSWPRWRDERAATEQVQWFFDERLVISFHAGDVDPFEPVRRALARRRWQGPRTARFHFFIR